MKGKVNTEIVNQIKKAKNDDEETSVKYKHENYLGNTFSFKIYRTAFGVHTYLVLVENQYYGFRKIWEVENFINNYNGILEL